MPVSTTRRHPTAHWLATLLLLAPLVLNLGCPFALVLFVDAAAGDDGNVGSAAAPFKTITRALSLSSPGTIVMVQPGTYDTANGETFPLRVPAGVMLIGDEANAGLGASATRIQGGDDGGTITPGGNFDATVLADTDSVIAGFAIQNPNNATNPVDVALRGDRVSVRDNTLESPGEGKNTGIMAFGGSGNHVITRNEAISLATALLLLNGGDGTRVEGNRFRQNELGVVIWAFTRDIGPTDFGGGAQGSPGANEFACNDADLSVIEVPMMTMVGAISAQNNAWARVPPARDTVGNPGTIEIVAPMGVAIDTFPETLAPGACT